MNCILLDKETITKLYNERMKKDFPPDELRPLSMTLDMIDKGTYEAYGLADGDEVIAYAFFVRLGNSYLFDYFAVAEGKRNSGIGGEFLKILREKFKDADCVIGEVEDPGCDNCVTASANTKIEDNTKNSANINAASLKARRLDFYLRNGFRNTGLKYKIFGVDFLIIEMGCRGEIPTEIISATYEDLYKSFLPPHIYAKNVIKKQNIS